MNVERRDFLKFVGAGALVSAVPSKSGLLEDGESKEQKLHQDYQSNNQGTEYYFLGNGLILAAVQTSSDPGLGTHCGLLLMSPEHFGRKVSTYLYHPERGLQNSRTTVVVDRVAYTPAIGSSDIFWEYPGGVPTVVIVWQAAECSIREELTCPIGRPAIARKVILTNKGRKPVEAAATFLLYPNLMLFDEYEVDRVRGTLTAEGYQTIRLFTERPSVIGDRFVSASFGSVSPGKSQRVDCVITLNYPRAQYETTSADQTEKETAKYWNGLAAFETTHKGLNHLFRTSLSGLRCAVAASGKMDGGIWQYNLEWVRDESMVATGAAMSGQTEIAEALLRRILTRSVDETGRTVDASRHRPPETMELDQNGELLSALYTHWVWSGSDSVIREHWNKIRNVAEFVLKPEFLDDSVGLVKNSREFWERDPGFGVKEGYENSYQLWNIIGLERASRMAAVMGDSVAVQRWETTSRKMKEAYLSHPKFSLIDQGRFIKRRLASGEVQRTFEPPNRKSMPQGMPLNVESVSLCDPDSANVLPIVYGIVDPASPVALKTLESMEELWNQRWDGGGYGRYHVTSEPDSPGPWPFPTMFIARAYLETGNDEKVWRALRWLQEAPGGKAGAWLEFYGDRPTPPLPPVGIVVWTWAEILMFFIHHLLGVRPSEKEVVLRPRLLSRIESVNASIPFRGRTITLKVVRDTKEQFAIVNGQTRPLTNGTLNLPIPGNDQKVEIHL